MIATSFLKTRVSRDTKQRVQAIARTQLITESIWLRRIIDAALNEMPATADHVLPRVIPAARLSRTRLSRISIRLRPDDQLLLHARATARSMAAATYLSLLARAHLRALPPLPKEELLALKRSVAELGAIGRTLNQIARAVNQGERPGRPSREELYGLLKVCEALRDHTKRLIKMNAASWESGDADANDESL